MLTMGKQRSLRSKAVNLFSDFTTVLLNPISDKPSMKAPFVFENEADLDKGHIDSNSEQSSLPLVEGPDTSSFTGFLYSLVKDDYFSAERDDRQFSKAPKKDEKEPKNENLTESGAKFKPKELAIEHENVNFVKESDGKGGVISKGRQSIGKAVSYTTRFMWFGNETLERMGDFEVKNDEKNGDRNGGSVREMENNKDEVLLSGDIPDMSENSLLLSEKSRVVLYASVPVLVKGQKWVLLYSTWRDGISLATLYRKSILCPGSNLLVVGDRGGAVFGGLVEAPLKPSKSRRYQGSNSTFLFTEALGQPIVYRPTGVNRYYTLCTPDFLALGGGHRFALYLDSDLLNGSSASCDTYGNPCLALSEDFVVKGVELWGFVYPSRYDDIRALTQNEPPGICRW